MTTPAWLPIYAHPGDPEPVAWLRLPLLAGMYSDIMRGLWRAYPHACAGASEATPARVELREVVRRFEATIAASGESVTQWEHGYCDGLAWACILARAVGDGEPGGRKPAPE